jgi:hypothetical protein
MAGGPLFPNSCHPVSTGAFWCTFISTSANSQHEEGLGVGASLAANTTWRMRFQLPPALPTGTMKLRVLSLSSAVTGALRMDTTWNRCPVSAVPGGVGLNNEGSAVITWAAGDNCKYLQTKVTLDATAAVASDIVVMDLVFLTSGNTQAAISVHQPSIIWE